MAFCCVAVSAVAGPAPLKYGEQSLKDVHPDLAAQWHPTRNIHPRTGAILGPGDVSPSSNFVAVWVCKDGSCGCPHIWSAPIDQRSGGHKTGCPFCSKLLACPCMSLAALHPKVAAEWDYDKNAGLTAEDGSPLTPENCPPSSSKKIAWFHVADDGKVHPWVASVHERTREGKGTSCPACNTGGGPPREVFLADEPGCEHLVQQWDYAKNGDLTPYNVTRGSHEVVWWICPGSTCQHPHSWQARIYQRANPKRGTGCPFCSKRLVCPCNSLQGKFPNLAKEYALSNIKMANAISPGSDLPVLWNCLAPGCGHTYLTSPKRRLFPRYPAGCIECSRRTSKGKSGQP